MDIKSNSILNFNIGCLGHVDSGKTSIVKRLSSIASTACFDKNPQSKERGITIDLGFSSLIVPLPIHIRSQLNDNHIDSLQFTFVDCPGHASLIKTIIGGAQIIHLMMLVIDITKGFQTQTAECLVIGEITCDKMVIVLNKIDLIPHEKRAQTIEKVSKRIYKTLEKSIFSSAPIVPVSANPPSNNDADSTDAGVTDVGVTDADSIDTGEKSNDMTQPYGFQELIHVLTKEAFLPKRIFDEKFILSVDHCFAIKGQGTVITGTLIQGNIKINDDIEIPTLKMIKKVKNIQMFHKSVTKASQGDRIGICVTQFDPKLLERGLICSPNYLHFCHAAVATVSLISYFKGQCSSRSKFHISVMHETVMAKVNFFKHDNNSFDINQQYLYVDDIPLDDKSDCEYFVLLQFEKPIILKNDALYIGSKLDSDIHANVCRLAFHGKIVYQFNQSNYIDNSLPNLMIYKNKCKEGIVERASNEYEVIVKNLFKKESNINSFVGLKVSLSTGEVGIIEGSFGQSGKVKVRVPSGLSNRNLLKSKQDKSQVQVNLKFKTFIYDKNKKIIQN